ncbi:hypothetical protein FPZ24_04240 [Sphingomonas panacisoli]|uniref:VanZ-like domain-containing protein n=1 Tax=Sphingomonas panacisoli TaxID=1813879 RepID=A0A5B8LGM4_9SPHN|nr:hypothetical protein [Sphingomonas panacisoli]QDZ06782.1 hypothetical protein FPZ24_04240 [Sphingomonas panacisoli]
MLLRILFWAAAVFAVVMAIVPHPPQIGHVSDKLQHMAAFGTLTLLAALAYPKADILRTAERLTLVGAVIEVVQSIPVLHRDRDIKDLIADCLAIGVATVIVILYRQLREPAPQSA